MGGGSHYMNSIRRGALAYGRAAGPWLVHNEPLLASMAVVRAWRPAGVLCFASGASADEGVLALGRPMVTVSASRVPGVPAVRPDNHAVGRLQAQHLIERGFADLCFFASGGAAAQQRQAGFVEAAEAAGVRFEADTPFPDAWPTGWEASDQGIGRWLAGKPKPLGLVCADDDRGLAVSEAAINARIPIPEQVAVIGANDDPDTCEVCYPPLSSVDLNLEKVGYEAARVLDQLMQGRPAESDETLIAPAGVVARRSTDTIALDDPLVVRALRLIRERADRPTSVEDVLDAVGVSRRLLEKRFRTAVGHTPLKQIQRVHIDRARELLRLTDLPMPDIARASGYTSATAMSVMFRKHTGEPPTAYRRRHRLG